MKVEKNYHSAVSLQIYHFLMSDTLFEMSHYILAMCMTEGPENSRIDSLQLQVASLAIATARLLHPCEYGSGQLPVQMSGKLWGPIVAFAH